MIEFSITKSSHQNKKDSWKNLKNPDRGGHDKADEYKDYNESSTISTYKTIIYTVKKIL